VRVISSIAFAVLVLGCDPAPSTAGAWCQYPSDCHRPLECSYHRCRAACVVPEDCPSHLCLAGHCAVDADQGCTSLGTACGSPLRCAEDRCTLVCAGSCANGATCRPARDVALMICVDPAEAPPASSDGGTADGA
jgi:hypothetical protein